MMTADEMLKELGYVILQERCVPEKNYICYYNSDYRIYISFCLVTRTIDLETDSEGIELSLQELQAINKKCEELGWI